ncbi:hypothetical protein FOZ63_006306, partial [Perkinsus olseni]
EDIPVIAPLFSYYHHLLDGVSVPVNMSSQASSIALPRHTAYCCSKAGLDMLSKMTALELGPYGIRCNSVCPTVVMTPMGTRVWGVEEKAKPMRDRIPLGRFAEMNEVTSAVLYLLSDASSMTTGSSITVDVHRHQLLVGCQAFPIELVNPPRSDFSRTIHPHANTPASSNKVLTRQMLQLRCRSDRLDMIAKLNLWGSDLGDVGIIGEAMPALEVCSLSVNRIRTLSGFRVCSRLRELYLRKNAIRDLEEVEHLRRHCRNLEVRSNGPSLGLDSGHVVVFGWTSCAMRSTKRGPGKLDRIMD